MHRLLFISGALLMFTGAARADGTAVYGAECAKCHGADGKADTPAGQAMKATPLVGGAHTAEQVTKTLREDPKHKAVSPKVNDADIPALATFLATLK